VEVELKTGVVVEDVEVDESEVNVVVEDVKEVDVDVSESAFVSVSIRKSRTSRETNLTRLCWTSCRYGELYASTSAQIAVSWCFGTREVL
jgi:hypothetical protein